MSFWENLDDEVVPAEASIPLCLRGDLIAELQRARQEHVQARIGDDSENRTPQAPAVERRIAELEDRIAAATRDFRFRCIGDDAWRKLLHRHPPTKEQRRDHGALYNPDVFPFAAMAVSLIEPEGVTETALRKMATLASPGDLDRLWRTCLDLHYEGPSVGGSVRSTGRHQSSRTSSTTALPEASPAASSSDAT